MDARLWPSPEGTVGVLHPDNSEETAMPRNKPSLYSKSPLYLLSLAFMVMAVAYLEAQTEITLHRFNPTTRDGILPDGTLVADKSGNLYGTTNLDGVYGFGMVFQLAP